MPFCLPKWPMIRGWRRTSPLSWLHPHLCPPDTLKKVFFGCRHYINIRRRELLSSNPQARAREAAGGRAAVAKSRAGMLSGLASSSEVHRDVHRTVARAPAVPAPSPSLRKVADGTDGTSNTLPSTSKCNPSNPPMPATKEFQAVQQRLPPNSARSSLEVLLPVLVLPWI